MERRRHCRRTLALLRRARPRNQGAVAGPMWRPRNPGVRGGTRSSNLLCSRHTARRHPINVSPTSPTRGRLRNADQAEPGDSRRTLRDPSFEASIAYTPASSGTPRRVTQPSACEHSSAQRTKASPRPAFSGGRDSETGAVRGTHVAPVGTLAFRVGRRVRISFAPAESLRTIGSAVGEV